MNAAPPNCRRARLHTRPRTPLRAHLRAFSCGALAALLCAAPAAAGPLDDWIAAAGPAPPSLLIVPRIDAIAEPLGRAVQRARSHPAVAAMTADTVADLVSGLGFDPFEPAARAAAGIDGAGPLLWAEGPAGPILVVAARDAERVGAALTRATGAAPTSIDGRPGWRWDGGAAVFADGALYVARDPAALTALRRAEVPPPGEPRPDPIGDCPAKRGEADLFFVSHRPSAAGCVVVRVDPGRVRVAAAGRSAGFDPGPWIGSGAGLPKLGPESSLLVGLTPGPALSAALSAGVAPERQPFVGPLALAVGPGALDVTFTARPAAPVFAESLLAAARRRAELVVEPAGEGLQRVAVKPAPAKPGAAAPPKPPIDAIWIGTRHDRFWVSTRAEVIARGPTAAPDTALSPDLFAGAGLVAWLRPAGLPHDGGPWADAVAPSLTALGIEMAGIRRVAGALAFLWAHLGELGLAVAADGPRWRVTLEVSTL